MTQPVPKDDLPENVVPANDLPESTAKVVADTGKGLFASVLGAPVDVIASMIRPFARMAGDRTTDDQVIGSSDWISKKLGAAQNLGGSAYKLGGVVTDAASKVLPPEGAAAAGYVANVGAQTLPMFLGGNLGKSTAPMADDLARGLMRSAMKPTLKAVQRGEADQAVNTMLREGYNVSRGNVEKMGDRVDDLNNQIAARIGNSTATVNIDDALRPVSGVMSKFAKQATPADDIASIEKVIAEFRSHPSFANLGAKEKELLAMIEQKNAAGIKALQDAGKYQTMAAQQANLATGGIVNLHPQQTLNTPYINVGSLGGQTQSPIAKPLAGYPRISDRYTTNAERVPEATAAASELSALAKQRFAEAHQLAKELDAYKAAGGGGIPVQLAQEIKQGTYRVLNGKYGELGSASTEAQKALARGLKDEIAKAVPDVGNLNRLESELINAMKLTSRRLATAENANPFGITHLSPSWKQLAAGLLDRISWGKSAVANGLYSGSIQGNVGRVGGGILGLYAGQPAEDDRGILNQRTSWVGQEGK